MDLDDAVARLAALTRLLDDPESSLLLEDLARSALSLVPSCLAVLVVVDGRPGALATVSDRYRQARVRSSLRLEFVSQASTSAHRQVHRVIFLAEACDAFSGFGALQENAVADAPAGAGPPHHPRHRLTDIVLDDDVEVADPARGNDRTRVLQPTGDVDRAIGFLIDRGHEPSEALHLLADRAQVWTLTMDEAADRILGSLE